MLAPLHRRPFLAQCLAAMCCLVAQPATLYAQTRAGGAVRVARHSLREHRRSWRLLMRIRVAKKPDTPELTLRFHLSQTVDFQPGKAPDKPRKVPVNPPRVIVQHRTVDMRDVHGDVSRSARAELAMSRDDHFRAGVWMLTVEGPNGPLQAPIRLTLEGVNGEAPNPKPDTSHVDSP